MGYDAIQAWLNGKAVSLRASGYLVEVQHAADSMRLRVESKEFIGEILLWKTLQSDVYVGFLKEGEFVFEEYGKIISSHLFQKDYDAFFTYFPE